MSQFADRITDPNVEIDLMENINDELANHTPRNTEPLYNWQLDVLLTAFKLHNLIRAKHGHPPFHEPDYTKLDQDTYDILFHRMSDVMYKFYEFNESDPDDDDDEDDDV